MEWEVHVRCPLPFYILRAPKNHRFRVSNNWEMPYFKLIHALKIQCIPLYTNSFFTCFVTKVYLIERVDFFSKSKERDFFYEKARMEDAVYRVRLLST